MYNTLLYGAKVKKVWNGTVHSAFNNAVNIFVDDTLYTLFANPLWISQTAIVVDDKSVLALFKQGGEVNSDGDYIHFNGEKVVSFTDAKIWRMPTVEKLLLSPKNLAWYDKINYIPTPIAAIVQKMFVEVATTFVSGSDVDFSGIIGAGEGLTPSGDDMLIGFLLAMMSQNRDKFDSLAPYYLPYVNNTTDVSKYMLIEALSGSFSEPLLNVHQAIKTGNGLDDAVKIAVNIGNSSGKDGLFGFYTGLKLSIR